MARDRSRRRKRRRLGEIHRRFVEAERLVRRLERDYPGADLSCLYDDLEAIRDGRRVHLDLARWLRQRVEN
jgi:hypothetical protein